MFAPSLPLLHAPCRAPARVASWVLWCSLHPWRRLQVRGCGKGALGGVSRMDFASCSGGASSGLRTNLMSCRGLGPRWPVSAQSCGQLALSLAVQLGRPGAPRRKTGLSILSAQPALGLSAVSSVGCPLCETALCIIADCGSAVPTLCLQALEMNEFDYCCLGTSVTNVHVDL